MDVEHIYSFEPISDQNADTLILGSMPGRASLAAGQYYAHSQNVFWGIISELLHLDPVMSYESRVQALKSSRIALWDVLRSCKREGSLDSMIESDMQTANNFHQFFNDHPQITRIFFNGAKAEDCFNRHVLHTIDAGSLRYTRLPSTSPANASIPYSRKLESWQMIASPCQPLTLMTN